MYKYLLGLVLFSSSHLLLAQGNAIFPPNPVLPSVSQAQPSFGYYPAMPYAYPAYPYNMGMQPYYPMQAPIQAPAQSLPYPYGAYPNAMRLPPANLAAPNQMQAPAPAPTYAYTSPYNSNQPAMPGPKPAPAPTVKKETKPWGDTRHIWPDFYTDQTSEAWDKMINAPHELGYMPGGWRFPSFSSPDPVTVGDAVANQMPPVAEEVPNFMNFTN